MSTDPSQSVRHRGRQQLLINVRLQPGGQTALHLAAERGNTTCLQILLNQQAIEVGSRADPDFLGRFLNRWIMDYKSGQISNPLVKTGIVNT
jgi:ankyrin repeat protein